MSRTHYFEELEAVRQDLVEMGQEALALFDDVLQAFTEPAPDALQKARILESEIDLRQKLIRDRCLRLITLQAPVARDALLITGVLDAIADFGLIGGLCCDIVSLLTALPHRPTASIMAQLSDLTRKVRGILGTAIDMWQGFEPNPAIRSHEAEIKADSTRLSDKLSHLTTGPLDTSIYVDLMMICRHLERILRHAFCVADQAIGAAPLKQAIQA